MLILKSPSRLYPIQDVLDSFSCVCNNSPPKALMNATVRNAWLNERRASGLLPNGKQHVLYVDNFSSHVSAPDMFASLSKLNTILQKFPRDATDMILRINVFGTQRIKKV